jgi:hypothetical protein
MKVSATKWVTGLFVASESALIVLSLTNVVVVTDVAWMFYAFAFAYLVAMVFVVKQKRRASRNKKESFND